jgi:hypothetical protein
MCSKKSIFRDLIQHTAFPGGICITAGGIVVVYQA